MPNTLGLRKCDEALFDADDLDEGTARYFEQNLAVPLRLARYTRAGDAEHHRRRVGASAAAACPTGRTACGSPTAVAVTALLDAYVVPEGVHCFENGNPCQSFDFGTYLTNLTARFFMTNGADVYYLSHPTSHLCLGTDVSQCGYLKP